MCTGAAYFAEPAGINNNSEFGFADAGFGATLGCMKKIISIPSSFLLFILSGRAADPVSQALTEPMKQAAVWKDRIITYLIENSGKLIGAVAIVVIGVFVSRAVVKLVLRALQKFEMEPPLRSLVARLVKLLVVGLAVVMALGTAGANIAALVAGIGVAGVGVGLAMQGMLSNIVAGVSIIFTKPFRVGEYIELLGVQGQVDMVELFSTKLRHPDRSIIVIPNRKIIGEILHNYGTVRQLDLSVSVAYDTDLTTAIGIVRDVLNQNPRVLKTPEAAVGVMTLADSGVHLAVKPWVKVPDYGPAGAELNQSIVERFRAKKIVIPFPQHEVRMLSN